MKLRFFAVALTLGAVVLLIPARIEAQNETLRVRSWQDAFNLGLTPEAEFLRTIRCSGFTHTELIVDRDPGRSASLWTNRGAIAFLDKSSDTATVQVHSAGCYRDSELGELILVLGNKALRYVTGAISPGGAAEFIRLRNPDGSIGKAFWNGRTLVAEKPFTDSVAKVAAIEKAIRDSAAARANQVADSLVAAQRAALARLTVRDVLNPSGYSGIYRDWTVDYEPAKGRGSIEVEPYNSWSVECTEDRINDAHYCELTRGYLTITKRRNAYHVEVGTSHYPGSRVALRVDKKAAVTATTRGWSGAAALPVISALKSGTNVVLRYTRWPDTGYSEEEMSLGAFSLALQMLDQLYVDALRKWR